MMTKKAVLLLLVLMGSGFISISYADSDPISTPIMYCGGDLAV